MSELNKKVLGLAVALMVIAMLAVPVMAKPTQGNKMAVTVTMVRNDGGGAGVAIDPDVMTGPINHRHRLQGYDITITFEDDSTLVGTTEVERKMVQVPQQGKMRIIIVDYYVFTFVSEGGGFEGNGLVMLDNVNGESKAYGLFHGTGAFEGQTLNIGHTWASYTQSVSGPAPWYGYWLKCQVHP